MSVSEPNPSAPLRVLVVDDLVDAADSLSLLLTLWGHEVRVEYDGRRALDSAQTFVPTWSSLTCRCRACTAARLPDISRPTPR